MGKKPVQQEPRITHQSLKVLRVFLDDGNREFAGADLFGATRLASGTLYPILLRLEAAGWLKSRWENVEPSEVARPKRRLYRITAMGVRRAEALLFELAGGLPA
jgi:PadR family transcriptional regulator, regulatory protein PadR